MSIHEYFTVSQKCISHELSSYCQIDFILVYSLYFFTIEIHVHGDELGFLKLFLFWLKKFARMTRQA